MPEVTQTVGRKTLKQFLEHQRSVLNETRSSFEPQWRDISRLMSPRRARFDVNDRNRGERKWNSIINNVATYSLRTAQNGMFAGTMSPARPWFALVHPDDALMESEQVKVWLHQVEQKILSVFRDSNFYNIAPKLIKDLIMFGTSAMTHMDDAQTVSRFFSPPVGTYALGLDDVLDPAHFVREFVLFVDQTVAKFGLNNVSQTVRVAYENSNYKNEVFIAHHIMPNPLIDPDNPFAFGKPYLGVYYEAGPLRARNVSQGASGYGGSTYQSSNKFLGVEGFFERPFLAPRWSVEGEDTYATECPGIIALGDVKQLQTQEKRKGQAIDKQTNPPLQAPPTVRNIEGGINALPGGVTFVETGGVDSGRGITTLYDVNLNLQELRADMQEVEQRIKDAFFVSLFLAITEMEGVQPRNEYELANRHDEALLQLGPVLQQVQGELLSPIVNRVFAQLVRLDDGGRNGILPPAPEALQGQPLEIRYISSLAQAQRAVATQPIDRLVRFTVGVAQIKPEAVDKIDTDFMIEEYGRATGTSPKAIVPDEVVAQIRQQRAEAEAAAQEMEMLSQGAGSVKDIASAVKE